MALHSPFTELDHELVQVTRDRETGVTSVVALHSTRLGPAMGGVRRADYATIDGAVVDAVRLSSAMTLKNSLAGLPLGGGKSVVMADAGSTADWVEPFGRVVADLGGRYVAAEDIGTSPSDMDRLADATRWVAGRSPEHGGTGDPSPSTALTVLGSIEHALRVRSGKAELAGTRVGVIGVGKVGARLCELLAERGAHLTVADIDAARAAEVAARCGARVDSIDAVTRAPVEVLAPCARGGFISAAVASALEATIVCGAANNILENDAVAAGLAARGILYVPEFAANAGGIVQVGGEFLGWSQEAIDSAIEDCVERVGAILDEAAMTGRLPLEVAEARARQALSVGAGA
jgi:glutamate dehydrogenase/leucine dehydrogenase